MIVSALLIGFFTLNFGVIGEERPRVFATVGAVGCVCDDSGVCQCTEAECGCADCPRTATTAKPPKRIVTKRVFSGYTYMRQCGPSGCRMVRVPMYHSVQVEE